MLGLWRAFDGFLILGIAGLGALSVTLVLWRWLPERGRRAFRAVLLVGWLAGLAGLTLTSQNGGGWIDGDGAWRTRGLTPGAFSYILDTADAVSWRVPAQQIGGNLLLFAPLGVLLVLFGGSRVPAWKALVAGAGIALVIESLQWVLAIGRKSTLDDVILAAAGAALALLIVRMPFRRLVQRQASSAEAVGSAAQA